jgi:hypothetical protein
MAADLANNRQLSDTPFAGSPRERGSKGEQYAREIQETTNGRRSSFSRKKGRTVKIFAEGASKSMYKSMSESELKRMASTKRKGKPTSKGK